MVHGEPLKLSKTIVGNKYLIIERTEFIVRVNIYQGVIHKNRGQNRKSEKKKKLKIELIKNSIRKLQSLVKRRVV